MKENTVLKIAVLMGGKSGERQISLTTGERIAKSLLENGYEVVKIDAVDHFWEKIADESPDVVFIALHGRWGEDGTVQGILELLNLPYTGSGILASALAMDKVMTKKILEHCKIPTPDYLYFDKKSLISTSEILRKLALPVVIKPVHEGSALGINIAKSSSQLDDFVNQVFEMDDQVLIESYIAGQEITVGVLEDENDVKVLPTVEIIPKNDFYDYEAKYSPGKSTHQIPAGIPKNVDDLVKQLSVKAHKSLGCRDFSRIDFKISEELKPFALEVNTIPGMTPTSLYPEAAASAGISFNELIDKMVKLAANRKKIIKVHS